MATRYWEVAFRSTGDGGTLIVNTFAVKVDGASLLDPDVPATDVADAVSAWCMTEYKALLPDIYHVNEVAVRSIIPDRAEVGLHLVNANGTLFAPGLAQVPRELCLLLSIKTDHASRSGRGRMFLPSPAKPAFLGDTVNWDQASAYWTAAGAFASKLLEGYDFTHDLIEYHMSMVLWSRKEGAARDVKSITRKPAYHWLRSRSTSP